MSLNIDIDKVKRVLLSDDVWYEVLNNSFDIDAYEFVQEGERLGTSTESTGFRFETERETTEDATARVFIQKFVMMGPLSSIKAIAY